MTAKTKPAAEKKAAPKARTTQKAEDLFEPVAKALSGAGPEGVTLAQVSDLTGVRGRVLHNVLYRMEKAGKVRRIQEEKGRRVRYASGEAKTPRKRAPRKAAATKKASESIRVTAA
jgi:predicted Rossmann fold nucleotide-binding protein DprA/Smf involved in DNA uptake